jgi:hypothetical protein
VPQLDSQRLAAAATTFREAKHHLTYSLGYSAQSFYVRERVTATGDDVQSAIETLIQEYVRAEAAFAAFVASPDGMVEFPEARRLETAFKSIYMWLRAFQDAALGSLLETRGERAGSYSSMNRALGPGRPIQGLLAAELPGYAEWFLRFKHLRDQMKLGAAFRTVLQTEPARITGISFAFPRRLTGDEVDEGFINLDDVIVALEWSASLSDLVRTKVESRPPTS